MKCLNCGKELDWSFEFEVGGNHNIGYDCECGYTSFINYIEETPPIVDSVEDFHQAILKLGGESSNIQGIVNFTIDKFSLVIEILSQCDFDFNLRMSQQGDTIIGSFWGGV